VSKDTTELASFQVLDISGTVVLPTVVQHHHDITTGYELITITQTNEDGSLDCVCMSRAQLAALAAQAKGH
jgi:hypothetical protein